MADVFKALLQSGKNRSARQSDEKIKSLMKSDETDFYNEQTASFGEEVDDELDITLGEERDSANYIADIEKISLRDLDKKSQKEQLKTLKLEYNRLFDKVHYLNNLLVHTERNYSDLVLEKRTDESKIKDLKSLFRNSINLLPGSPDLKEVVNRGSWSAKEITPLMDKAMKNIISRYTNVDKEVQDAVSLIDDENTKLKAQVLKYKKIAAKVTEIEKRLMNGEQQGGITQQSINDADVSTETVDEVKPIDMEPKTESDTQKQEEEKSIHKPSKHQAHFSNMFSDLDKTYQELKEQGKNSPGEKTEQTKDSVEDKHPLSPDFVETEKQEVSDLFDGNLQSYLNNISDNQEFVLRIIGKTGISRNPDLRDYLTKHEEGSAIYMKGKKFDYQHLSADVAELRGKNILEEEKISMGGKGGGANIIVYELSKIGKQCYKYLFKDNPVVPEKKRMLDHHASLEHGYLIKDSAKIFSDMGYTVYTDLKDVTIYTEEKGSERKIFDFIVEDENKKKMHIEVERGTHNKEDFFHAMDKIYKITKEFYFICPSDNVKNQSTKQLFFGWIQERLGGIRNADVVLNMTTINTLRKKPKNIWEVTNLTEVK